MTNNIELDPNIQTHRVQNYKEDKYEFLRNLPENDSIYHCSHCRYIFNINHEGMTNILTILNSKWVAFCPECHQNDSECICKVDVHAIKLRLQNKKCISGDMVSGAELCPVCSKAICPTCFNHSVIALSRVTGYVQSLDGWNKGKQQEFKDRQRYTISR